MRRAPNLWSDEIPTYASWSPVTILQEAAAEFRQATGGAVEAEVKLDPEASSRDRLVYDLALVSKERGRRHRLLYICLTRISLYPCLLVTDRDEEARDEAEMRDRLTAAFRGSRTVDAVKTLLAAG